MIEVATPNPTKVNKTKKEPSVFTSPLPKIRKEYPVTIQNQGASHPTTEIFKYQPVSKAQPLGPLNIVKQLKRVLANVSLWDILGIPE